MGPETQGSRVRGRRLPDGDTRKRPGKREPARGQRGATRRREPRAPGRAIKNTQPGPEPKQGGLKLTDKPSGKEEATERLRRRKEEARRERGKNMKMNPDQREGATLRHEHVAPEPGWGVVSQDPWLRGFGAESRLHTFQVPTVPLPTERREAEHRRPSRAVAGKTQKRNFKERRRCQLDSLSPHRVCPGHTRPLLESGPKHSHLKLIKPLDPATHVQEPQAAEVCFK